MKTKDYKVIDQAVFVTTNPNFPSEALGYLKSQLSGLPLIADVISVEDGMIKLPLRIAEVFDDSSMIIFHFALRTAFDRFQADEAVKKAKVDALIQRLRNLDQEAEKHPL